MAARSPAKTTRKAGKIPSGTAPEIKFGKLYRDRITGFEGVCTGFSSFISGCDQVLLHPKVGPDGKREDGLWIDDDRLIDVEAEARVARTSRKGGPPQGPSKS